MKYSLRYSVILECLVLGFHPTAAAALFCYSSDDLPRLPSAATIVGSMAYWFELWEREADFLLPPCWH